MKSLSLQSPERGLGSQEKLPGGGGAGAETGRKGTGNPGRKGRGRRSLWRQACNAWPGAWFRNY